MGTKMSTQNASAGRSGTGAVSRESRYIQKATTLLCSRTRTQELERSEKAELQIAPQLSALLFQRSGTSLDLAYEPAERHDRTLKLRRARRLERQYSWNKARGTAGASLRGTAAWQHR